MQLLQLISIGLLVLALFNDQSVLPAWYALSGWSFLFVLALVAIITISLSSKDMFDGATTADEDDGTNDNEPSEEADTVCTAYLKQKNVCATSSKKKKQTCRASARAACLDTERILRGVDPSKWKNASETLAACNASAIANKKQFKACKKTRGTARQECVSKNRKACFASQSVDEFQKHVFAALPY